MRLKRDYFAFFRQKYEWFISRFKPFTVHTEAIVIDEVWEKIKERVEKNDVYKWYVLTPVNVDYLKSNFNVNLSKKDISKIMRERYKWMLEKNQKIELHVHLSQLMSNLSYEQQEKMISEAVRWMREELNIGAKEFVPGWWDYNNDTLGILKKYKLKLIKPADYDFSHDFNWICDG